MASFLVTKCHQSLWGNFSNNETIYVYDIHQNFTSKCISRLISPMFSHTAIIIIIIHAAVGYLRIYVTGFAKRRIRFSTSSNTACS